MGGQAGEWWFLGQSRQGCFHNFSGPLFTSAIPVMADQAKLTHCPVPRVSHAAMLCKYQARNEQTQGIRADGIE